MFVAVNELLAARGLVVKSGTAVEVTHVRFIAAGRQFVITVCDSSSIFAGLLPGRSAR